MKALEVGDRIRHADGMYGGTKATVTELTARGFKWVLDEPWSHGHRHHTTIGGEDYTDLEWRPDCSWVLA